MLFRHDQCSYNLEGSCELSIVELWPSQLQQLKHLLSFFFFAAMHWHWCDAQDVLCMRNKSIVKFLLMPASPTNSGLSVSGSMFSCVQTLAGSSSRSLSISSSLWYSPSGPPDENSKSEGSSPSELKDSRSDEDIWRQIDQNRRKQKRL